MHLLQRPHRIVSKDEVLDAVWGNKVVTDGSLKHCLMEIRAAIGDRDHKVIRTVARRGYILETAVTKASVVADRKISILVVPIHDQSVGGEYIADGLTEEIITELSKVQTLRVIARASAMRLKGVGVELQDIAHRLGVDFILDGSVRKWGDKLRVSLQLSHLDSGDARWSERYDRNLSDLFEIQDAIAGAVAEELAMRIGGPEPTDDDELEDPRAVEPYLRARYEILKFSKDGLQQAERHLINGLERVDPNARLLGALGHAYAKYSEQRSLETNPADPDALAMLGYLCALSGQNERASQLFDEALDVDPLTPLNHCMPGFVAVMEGRYADAHTHYRRFLELDPKNPFAIWTWSYVLLCNGRVEEASEAVRELKTDHAGSALAQLGVALVHGVCGEREAAREAVTDELRAAARNSELLSRELTHCLALAGETEEALSWLENTVRIGNVNYPFWSQHNQWVDGLRADARFDELMIKVKQDWMSVVSNAESR